MSAQHKKTALIAMSGGVDSSVAAWRMLREGWDCMGVTMRLFRNPEIGQSLSHPCCSQADIDDAAHRRAADDPNLLLCEMWGDEMGVLLPRPHSIPDDTQTL